MSDPKGLTRNLGLDLVRVTEMVALAVGRWMGLGNRMDADADAIATTLAALNTLDMDGLIVIGEESKSGLHSPLDSGQRVGNGNAQAGRLVGTVRPRWLLVANADDRSGQRRTTKRCPIGATARRQRC